MELKLFALIPEMKLNPCSFSIIYILYKIFEISSIAWVFFSKESLCSFCPSPQIHFSSIGLPNMGEAKPLISATFCLYRPTRDFHGRQGETMAFSFWLTQWHLWMASWSLFLAESPTVVLASAAKSWLHGFQVSQIPLLSPPAQGRLTLCLANLNILPVLIILSSWFKLSPFQIHKLFNFLFLS